MRNLATRLLTSAILFSSVRLLLLAQEDRAEFGPWSGIVGNSIRTADEAFAESPKCTENRGPGAKLAFYNDTTRKSYNLEPRIRPLAIWETASPWTAHSRTMYIQMASIKMLNGIGLSVAEKA